MSADDPRNEERDEELGAALSGIPTPDHGPTFWADLDHRLQGETVLHQTEPATDAGLAHDGPTLQDRNGGSDAPDHAVADVDQASGVLLQLTQSSGKTVRRFAAGAVTTSDRIDRARYRLDPPAGSRESEFSSGYVARTLD